MSNRYEIGRRYEGLVCDLTDGRAMRDLYRNAPYDVYSGNQTRLEVKGSALHHPGACINGRWEWGDFLGKGRMPKQYDRLILVGEGLQPFDPVYFFFDVPYDWVLNYTSGHRHRTLQFGRCNSWSPLGYELWTQYNCSPGELRRRYGVASSSEATEKPSQTE